MPEKIVEKFGRVFIKKLGSSDYKLLKSTSFSNLDFKWYDVCGEVHPHFKKFTGKKFSVGFSMSNLNSAGTFEDIQGRLLVALKLGQPFAADVEYLNSAAKTEWRLARELDLIPDDEEDEMTKSFRRLQGYSGFLLPGKRPLEKSPLLAYNIVANILDDMMDDLSEGVPESLRKQKYQQTMRYFQGARNNLRGDGASWSDVDFSQVVHMPNIGLHSMLQFRRMYSCLLETTKWMRKEALKFGTEQEAKHFFNATLEGMETAILEVSLEWREKDENLFQGAHLEIKKILSGMQVVLEIIALQLGIRVSDEIRSSWLFKWYQSEYLNFFGKLNDLLSYNKEMVGKDAKQNQVYVLHVQENLPLREAFQRVFDGYNQSVLATIECGKTLLEIFEKDTDVKRYVEMVEETSTAFLTCMAHISRYHSNIVFDCYIDENEE